MKKILMFCVIAITLISCTGSLTAPLIITSINSTGSQTSYVEKYKIEVNNCLAVFTNHLYQVGDTLK